MTLEHVQYSRGKYPCLFIFGRDEEGNRVKIRWYSQREDTFGELLRDSPFFRAHAPWIFAVQKEADAMEMVGSLPNLGRIRLEAEEAELEYLEKYVEQLVRESKKLDAIDENKTNDDLLDLEYDKDTPLDDIIGMIEKSRRKKR